MSLTGHKEQQRKLLSLVNSDKLAQTLIFSGSAGIGKKLLAMQLAKTIFCSKTPKVWNGCNNCKICLSFTAHNMPDFHLIECSEKENVSTEETRSILTKVSFKSFTASSKIVIFNDAEYLPVASSNILLKSLEEPVKDLYYILVSANPSRLPVTILSRCQSWHFSDLTEAEIAEVINNKPEILPDDLQEKEKQNLLKYAGGNLSTLIQIAAHYNTLTEMKAAFPKIIVGDVAVIHQIIKKYAKDKEALPAVLFILQNICNLALKESSEVKEQKQLANFLHNLNQASYYLFTRNLNTSSLFSQVLISGATNQENDLIENWIV